MSLHHKTGILFLFAILILGYTSYLLSRVDPLDSSFVISIAASTSFFLCAVWLYIKLQDETRRSQAAKLEIMNREAKYRQLIEDAGVVMFTTDRHGIFTFVSNKTAVLTGYTKEEAVGKHFSFLIAPGHTDAVAAHYIKQYQSGIDELYLDFEILTKDKQEKWVEQHSVLIREGGRITGFQCIVKDITDRKRAEAQLLALETQRKKYEYRVQAILDHAPLMIYLKDLQGKFLVVNKHFNEIYGLDNPLVGKTDHDKDPFGNAALHRSTDALVLEKLNPVEMEVGIWRKGEKKNLLLIKFPLFDTHGKVFAIGAVATDVTESVAYRQQLLLTKEKLEKATTEKEDILARISHEIRIPMKGVGWLTERLTQNLLTEEEKNTIADVRQSYNKLLQLSKDIKQLSTIQTRSVQVQSTRFDVADLMELVVAPFKTRMKEADIELITGIHPDIPELILGDPGLLMQILSNLFSNAILCTHKGYIQLGAFPAKDGMVQFVVRDSGSGNKADIPLNNASHTSRADHGLDGSELGLELAKQLVELQNGTIEIIRSEGLGTTCRFSIPYSHIEAPQFAGY